MYRQEGFIIEFDNGLYPPHPPTQHSTRWYSVRVTGGTFFSIAHYVALEMHRDGVANVRTV